MVLVQVSKPYYNQGWWFGGIFYVDINPITRQVVTSRMMELIARFPQQFATIAWKVSFTFLPSNIQLIHKEHMELLGLVDLIISGWEC